MSADNIPISSLTEATEVQDSDWLAIDDGTNTKKISVENFNATGTASAQASATAAAASATAAAGSATDALGYKNTVEAALNDASTIVSNAQTYANSAESSKNDASGYASAASTSASQAATSASQAASYATGVQAYAIEAKSYAEGGTGTRVDEETTNCAYYANAAHTSETNAATSETNAASSESNAATSETNAAASATSASADALKAEGYAVGSQNGTPAVSGEDYYHDNAKYYKEEAATSASNASTSETNAGLSETAAAASETAAKGSEEDSEAWAWGKIDGVDVPATHPAYHNNAKYYADQAGGATAGVSTWNARSGNVVPESGDYTASQVLYDNTDSGLNATETNGAIDELAATKADTSSLGTAAALDVPESGNASTTEVVKGDDTRLSDARTPVSHGHTTSDITNFPTLGTAAALDVAVSGNASSSQVVKGDDTRLTDARTPTSHSHAWSEITSKPFSTLGNGLSVVGDALIPDVTDVALEMQGTASATTIRSQSLDVNGLILPIKGTSYMEQTITTSTSADVTATFTNSDITTNSVIEDCYNVYGISASNIVTTSGQCVITIPKQSSAFSLGVRIYIR